MTLESQVPPAAVKGSSLGISILTPLIWWLRNVPIHPPVLVGIVDKVSGERVPKAVLTTFLPFLEQTTVHLTLQLQNGRERPGSALEGCISAPIVDGLATFPGLVVKQASPHDRLLQLKATAVGPRNLKFSVLSTPFVIFAPAISPLGLIPDTGLENAPHVCPMCGTQEQIDENWGTRPSVPLRFCLKCANSYLDERSEHFLPPTNTLAQSSKSGTPAVLTKRGPTIEVPHDVAALLLQYHQLKQAFTQRVDNVNNENITFQKSRLEGQLAVALNSHGLDFGDLGRMREDFAKRYRQTAPQDQTASTPKRTDATHLQEPPVKKRTKPNGSPLTRRTHVELSKLFVRHTIYLLSKATDYTDST